MLTSMLQGLVSALPFAIAAAAFHLYRQNRRRAIVATAIMASAFTVAVGLSVRPIRASANRTLYETVAPHVANPERPVGDTQHWKEWLQSRQREFDSRTAFWMDLQNAMTVAPFALFGVVLARRRGWGVLGAALRIVIMLLFVIAVCSIFPVPAFPSSQWISVALMLVAGLLRLWLDESRTTPHALR